jgi:hypothetical protein
MKPHRMYLFGVEKRAVKRRSAVTGPDTTTRAGPRLTWWANVVCSTSFAARGQPSLRKLKKTFWHTWDRVYPAARSSKSAPPTAAVPRSKSRRFIFMTIPPKTLGYARPALPSKLARQRLTPPKSKSTQAVSTRVSERADNAGARNFSLELS